jgi:hypothetical protein
MRYPAELYTPSLGPYTGLQELNYPFHDMTVTVTECGRLCFARRKVNLSQVFAGQNVGAREIADHVWLTSFMHYDLGFFDDQCSRVECAPNPFTAKVTHVSGIIRYPCDENGPCEIGAPGEIRTPDPQVRSLMLYPTELRARRMPIVA